MVSLIFVSDRLQSTWIKNSMKIISLSMFLNVPSNSLRNFNFLITCVFSSEIFLWYFSSRVSMITSVASFFALFYVVSTPPLFCVLLVDTPVFFLSTITRSPFVLSDEHLRLMWYIYIYRLIYLKILHTYYFYR
jgi:hypothetical protein